MSPPVIPTKLDREKIKALCEAFEARGGLAVAKLENLDSLADEEIYQALCDDMNLCRDQVEDACQFLERELGGMLFLADLTEQGKA